MASSIRAAAVQFAIDTDRDENLATCRRMIDAAAAEGAELIVLPEFCNHPSWYDDTAHARAVAVAPGDPWLDAIAERARHHGAFVMVNATRRADDGRVFGSNFLFDPTGALVAVTDKQVLMGGESIHLSTADQAAELVSSAFGSIGLYSCMDGVIAETPRSLAVRGARILCNSLNSFANDEATLHVPVRAAENRVFVVAANKVGPLIPAANVEEVAAKLQVPATALVGAGESQIVAPDGEVLAKAPKEGEAVAVADIDPSLADDKRRPDGTDRMAARRPALYAPMASRGTPRRRPEAADELPVAALQTAGDSDRIAEAVSTQARSARLLVLPELATERSGEVDDAIAAAARGADLIAALVEALAGTDTLVVMSVADRDARHVGVVVGADGVVLRQAQLHAVARHGWVKELGDGLATLDVGWGRLAVVVGDDATYPEAVRLAALAEADVVAVPFDVQESWETRTGLVERAAENRLCLVAATRPSDLGTSLVCDLHRDFTLWTTWEQRTFDGCISQPIIHRAGPDDEVLRAVVHPAAAANRVLTRATDVVASRPWWLADALVGLTPASDG